MSGALATWKVELGLGGSYRAAVLADSPVGYWPLDEFRGTAADDKSTKNHDGAYVNTPTFGVVGPCPEGGTAAFFGATESMDVADHADHKPASISVELWVYPMLAGADRAIAIKANNTLTNGFGFIYASSDRFAFFVGSLSSAISTPAALNTWTHLVGTYDGTNLRLYKNGVLVAGPTAGPGGAIAHDASAFRVGTHAALANSFGGRVAHVPLYSTVLSAATALGHYTAGSWSDVSVDLDGKTGMTIQRGIPGSTPNDRMVGTGTATFALKNHAGNAAGLQGYYSLRHANARAGFAFGIPVRITASHAGTTTHEFRGKLHTIDTDTGRYRKQLTHCLAHDVVRDLAVQKVRQVDLQINQFEDALIYEILESLPFDARPVGVSIDPGLDTYPYGFDSLGSGRFAQAILSDVVVSAQGLMAVDGEGVLKYTNRQSMAQQSTLGTLTDGVLVDLTVPNSLDLVFNRVRITTHPKKVDAAVVVLWAHDGVASVPPNGGTLEIWGDYRDPTNEDTLVGGTAMVTPVSGTDFSADAASDGSGADITASVTVTASFFASTVKLVLTNNHATSTAYFVDTTTGAPKLQVRGKGVYDLSPVKVEKSSVQPYGDRLLELDLPFQDDANVAQGLADAIEVQYNQLSGQVESFAMNPQASPSEMDSALAIANNIGLPLAITETMSGLQDATVMVRSVDLQVQAGGWFTATFGVAPRSGASVFVLDESLLDDPEDILSYA